jgi:hypothetical protein
VRLPNYEKGDWPLYLMVGLFVLSLLLGGSGGGCRVEIRHEIRSVPADKGEVRGCGEL